MDKILEEIFEKSDPAYKAFQEKLVPTIEQSSVLGLRAPLALAIAKKYAHTDLGEAFLCTLPHKFYDENIVHAFMLGLRCDSAEKSKAEIIRFLPFVDNWAVCDGLCSHLKTFFKDRDKHYDFVLECARSQSAYTCRFGLVCLLNYYIDQAHIDDILKICKSIQSEEYYVKMAVAWLLSFCLIKEYDDTIPLIESKALSTWVHNKSIQKARESRQLSHAKKDFLKSLKVKE